MPKMLVVNASPHGEKGITGIIQKAFVEGAVAAGAEVDEVFLNKKKINPCIGCFTCWIKTPGKCVFKDDQAALIEKCNWCDILVLATPLYVDGMTAQAKIFLDRLIPCAKPEFIILDDHCRHPQRIDKEWKFVLISGCGFYEMDNFEALQHHCERICLNFHAQYAGHVLRPHAHILEFADMLPEETSRCLNAINKAGEEVCLHGKISDGIMTEASAPIVPRSAYVNAVNVHWDQELSKIKQK
jgi:multimeric flavodoxin WrbA